MRMYAVVQLTGYAFTNADAPLRGGYAPISELAVVLGPNDSGKSHLLARFQRDLNWPTGTATPRSAVFFALGDEQEIAFYVEHCLADRITDDISEGFGVRSESQPSGEPSRGYWPLGVWDARDLDRYWLGAAEDPRELWLAVLADLVDGTDESWHRAVLPSLRQSRLLAFEPDLDEDGDPVLNVYWCLPPLSELSNEEVVALRQSELTPFDDIARSSAMTITRERMRPTAHLCDESAPIVVAPLGRTYLRPLPVAVRLPSSFDEIREDLVGIATQVIAFYRFEEADSERELELDIDRPERADTNAWIELSDEGSTTHIHPSARHVCDLLGATATGFLPSFVNRRYELEVVVRPVSEWAGQAQVELRLRDRENGGIFGLEEVADGHRLWLQLALTEAVTAVLTQMLLSDWLLVTWFASRWELDAMEDVDEEHEPRDGLREDAHHEEEVYRSQRDRFESAERLSGWQGPSTAAALYPHVDPRAVTEQDFRILNVAPSRFYIVDEPERHLHPRLQREAARWLADVVRQSSSQALIATHAPPFLNIGPDAPLIYVRRQPGERAQIETLGSESLEHLTAEALELGLDRGELLTLVSVFLFVEGRHDRVVLEELLGPELKAAGIAVIPLRGVSRSSGILDAEVLLRFSSAPAAAWFDNVAADTLDRMQSDQAFTEEIRQDKNSYNQETRTMAELLLAAWETGRDILALPHPAADIFDLLDENLIAELFPAFPGHAEGRAAYAEERKRQNLSLKTFYWQRYGIPDDVNTFRRVARAMSERGQVPEAIRDVAQRCEFLSVATAAGAS